MITYAMLFVGLGTTAFVTNEKKDETMDYMEKRMAYLYTELGKEQQQNDQLQYELDNFKEENQQGDREKEQMAKSKYYQKQIQQKINKETQKQLGKKTRSTVQVFINEKSEGLKEDNQTFLEAYQRDIVAAVDVYMPVSLSIEEKELWKEQIQQMVPINNAHIVIHGM